MRRDSSEALDGCASLRISLYLGSAQVRRQRARCVDSLPSASRCRSRSTAGSRATARRRCPATTATPTLSSRYMNHVAIVVEPLAVGRRLADQAAAIDVEVEGAVRRRQLRPGIALMQRQRRVAPLLVDRNAFGDEALVAVQRGRGRGLADRAAVAGRLRQQRVERLRPGRAGRRPSRCASRSWHRSWRRR